MHSINNGTTFMNTCRILVGYVPHKPASIRLKINNHIQTVCLVDFVSGCGLVKMDFQIGSSNQFNSVMS